MKFNSYVCTVCLRIAVNSKRSLYNVTINSFILLLTVIDNEKLYKPMLIFDELLGLLLVAWRSGNALCRINEFALRRARLVLGWVTAMSTGR